MDTGSGAPFLLHTVRMDMRILAPEEFPAALREIPQPPEQLWMMGQFPPPETKLLAVVGSRALSAYGREAATNLISGLSGYPVSIVSGLALGTDGVAHKAALQAGLHTIAVPGSGLSERAIYPRAIAALAKEILTAGGALLSEHDAEYRPQAYDFPSRNRIMVGLSHAVLIIEAGEKSGTLITARLAHEYNRDLLCVPHRIGDPHGFGAHMYLRLGAGLVTESAHILEALGIEKKKEPTKPIVSLTGAEGTVYDILYEPLPRDEVLRRAHLDPSDVLSALVTLELKGILKEEFGSWRRMV